MYRIAALLILVAGCASAPTTPPQTPPTQKPPVTQPQTKPVPSSIGSATMNPDGTIVLQLRAEGDGGLVGDALIQYAPDHPQYQEVLAHLGGLSPGESKPVPPFPDKDPNP